MSVPFLPRVTISLESELQKSLSAQLNQLSGFPENIDFEIGISASNSSQHTPNRVFGDPVNYDSQIEISDNGKSIQVKTPVAQMEIDDRRASVRVMDANRTPGFLLNHLILIPWYLMLSRQQIFGLHCAAVEAQGQIHLVFGPSESGKTTLCHRLTHSGSKVYADELVWVWHEQGIPHYCPVPRSIGRSEALGWPGFSLGSKKIRVFRDAHFLFLDGEHRQDNERKLSRFETFDFLCRYHLGLYPISPSARNCLESLLGVFLKMSEVSPAYVTGVREKIQMAGFGLSACLGQHGRQA